MKTSQAIEDFKNSLRPYDGIREKILLNILLCLNRDTKANKDLINRQGKLIKILREELKRR